MFWTNYHQHCHFCDGVGTPEEVVEAALAQGVASLGFSSHATIPLDVPWCIKPEKFDEYIATIRQLREKYVEVLPIFVGMEIDYIRDIVHPCEARFEQLDYRIGSIHYLRPHNNAPLFEVDGTEKAYREGLALLFDNDIRRAVECYYATTREMLHIAAPDIVGHLDKIKMNNDPQTGFKENETWYREAVYETLETIAKSKVMVEVNTRGVYKKKTSEPYPSYWILERIQELKIPIMLNSDAHHPREVTGEFEPTLNRLQQMGFRSLQIRTNEGWTERSI